MNRYNALRAGPAYNHLARAEDIARRFRAKTVRRPPLLLEERVVDSRTVLVRVEEIGDRVRATVAVRHRFRPRDFEMLGWIPAALQRKCAEIAREALAGRTVDREWTWGGAFCAETLR